MQTSSSELAQVRQACRQTNLEANETGVPAVYQENLASLAEQEQRIVEHKVRALSRHALAAVREWGPAKHRPYEPETPEELNYSA